MTEPYVDDDPRRLPLFAASNSANGHARPGRVRSAFRYDDGTAQSAEVSVSAPRSEVPTSLVTAAELPVPLVPRRKVTTDMDWAAVARLRSEASAALTEDIGERPSLARAEQEGLGRSIIERLLDAEDATTVAQRGQARDLAERQQLADAVFDALFRLGRLQPLLDDPEVENVMITGFDRVIIERADGTLVEADPVADSDEELLDFLSFMAARADNPRPFSSSQPSLHLRLDDGSRLAAARDTARPSVMIRRHRVRRVTLADLVDWHTLSPVMASFLSAAVKARRSIVVSGGQGDGKTTLVRALCAEIDPWEVIGTFETEHELFLHELPEQHRVVHAWEERPGSGERTGDGRSSGERRTPEQVIDSFRFTLSRQILGEIRGPEVWSMIKLMESGAGSLSTTHAADAYSTMRKLITCAMEAGPHVTMELAATKLADTIDLVVQLRCEIAHSAAPGSVGRKIRRVAEILVVEPGEENKRYSLTSIFRSLPGACGVADTPPPGPILDQLIAHGFDYSAFLAEADAHPRRQP
ncbi:MAG: Flp pilus assembly complex ATPase component TadA [Actinobacteria bacterium]|nr:Flp pilus assembly complex ATPase component TadA [Actinomycetota bacterium]